MKPAQDTSLSTPSPSPLSTSSIKMTGSLSEHDGINLKSIHLLTNSDPEKLSRPNVNMRTLSSKEVKHHIKE